MTLDPTSAKQAFTLAFSELFNLDFENDFVAYLRERTGHTSPRWEQSVLEFIEANVFEGTYSFDDLKDPRKFPVFIADFNTAYEVVYSPQIAANTPGGRQNGNPRGFQQREEFEMREYQSVAP